MPFEPKGKKIFEAKNNYAVPMPIERIATYVLNMPEILQIQGGREFLTQKMKHIHETMVRDSPGACNAMVVTFLQRVFDNTNDIESPWLSEGELEQIRPVLATRQSEYRTERMRSHVTDEPFASGAEANIAATNRMMTRDSAFTINLTILVSKGALTGPLAAEIQSIADVVKTAQFCHCGVVGPMGGHAIAFLFKEGRWYLLDPNYGFYRYDSEAAFREDLVGLFQDYGVKGYTLSEAKLPPSASGRLLDQMPVGPPGQMPGSTSTGLLNQMPGSTSTRLLNRMPGSPSASTQLLNRMPGSPPAGEDKPFLDDQFYKH